MPFIAPSYGRFVTFEHDSLAFGYPKPCVPNIDSILTLTGNGNIPGDVDRALVVLHSILKGKSSMDRDARIKAISVIYHIVFIKHDRIWTMEQFILLDTIFKFVSYSPFNRRTIWLRWRPYYAATDLLYVNNSKNNPRDAAYNAHMTKLVDSIVEAEKEEICDTHHPCEYEYAMGVRGEQAMDYSQGPSVGLEEVEIHFIGQ